MSLFLISTTLRISQPFCHVCCWRRKKLLASMKTLCYSLPSHLKRENFVSLSAFRLSFVFFWFRFWPMETTTTNLLGLTHSDLLKSINQVNLSSKHMNNLLWGKVSLSHKSLRDVYFPLCISCWSVEGRACMIDHRQRHLRYGTLEDKNISRFGYCNKLDPSSQALRPWETSVMRPTH